MIGKIAKNNDGEVGIITYEFYGTWIGKTMNGDEWECLKPIVIANSINEYVKNNIDEFLPEVDPSELK